MNTTTLRAATPAAALSNEPRFDIYTAIHKALRSFMTDTLARVGRLDVHDADELAETMAQFDALMTQCHAHLEHENTFLHTAIETRQPGGATRTAADHVEHVASIDALAAEGRALVAADAAERPPRALRLYRHLALFVAENFQHMHVEETVNAATLWARYSDAELCAIHDRLLASLPPQENLQVARWMVPAISPAERAGMFGGMKAQMPPEAFLGVLMHVRPHLDARGWTKLTRALGVQLPEPVPVS